MEVAELSSLKKLRSIAGVTPGTLVIMLVVLIHLSIVGEVAM
jgi:hypothetical protein